MLSLIYLRGAFRPPVALSFQRPAIATTVNKKPIMMEAMPSLESIVEDLGEYDSGKGDRNAYQGRRQHSTITMRTLGSLYREWPATRLMPSLRG